MHWRLGRAQVLQRGVTLPEVLVGVFIFGTLVTAVVGLATLGTRTAIVSEQRTVAQAIANERAEQVRLTPYADVGLNDGSDPDGIFLPAEDIIRNGQNYTVQTEVKLVDDPENGTLTDPITEANADYKQVFITVSPESALSTQQDVQVGVFSVPQASQPECTYSEECSLGEVCCGESCQPICKPGSCPPNWVCSADGCGCVPKECDQNFDCPTGLCSEGVCIPPECERSLDCAGDLVCDPDTKKCEPPECDESTDCAGNQVCDPQSSRCEPPCDGDSDCGSGSSCDLGTGTCTPPPGGGCTSSADCGDGLICDPVSGSCVEPPCGNPGDCSSGQTCDLTTHECQPRCDDDGDCGNGTCDITTGQCFPPGCTTNADCGDGDICDPTTGRCEPGACTTNAECGSNCCIGGSCQACGCTTNADCAGNQVCNTTTGQCQPVGCTDDSQCGAGSCCNAQGQCGACGPGNPCTSSAQCGIGQQCSNGQCQPIPPGGGAGGSCPAPIVGSCTFGVQVVTVFYSINNLCVPVPSLLSCNSQPPGGNDGFPIMPSPSQCDVWCSFDGDCTLDCGPFGSCSGAGDCNSPSCLDDAGNNVCECSSRGECIRDVSTCTFTPSPTECQSSADCGNNPCISGRCMIPNGGGACPPGSETWPNNPGYCVPNQPLPGNNACTSDADCGAGNTCDTPPGGTTDVCMTPAGCGTTGSCAPGMVCQMGVCVNDPHSSSCTDCGLDENNVQITGACCVPSMLGGTCHAEGERCIVPGGTSEGTCKREGALSGCQELVCDPDPTPPLPPPACDPFLESC